MGKESSCSWLHRTPKEEKQNKADFYQTRYELTFALLEELKEKHPNKDLNILDPAAGLGKIGDVLKTHYNNVTEYDLYSGTFPEVDFFSLPDEHTHDIIVMNPPFSRKWDFIDKALKVASYVYVLLPVLAENYNIANVYKEKWEYYGKITCYPKLQLSAEWDQILWGGTSCYAWQIYSAGPNYRGEKLTKLKYEKIYNIKQFTEDAKNLEQST